jgi:hypothetical protein
MQIARTPLAGALALALCLPWPVAAGAPKPLELSGVIGGQPVTPVVDGDRVYLAAGRTITTWNYEDPTRPAVIATTETPSTGQIVDLERHGPWLYAGWNHANENSGIAIYSLANPDAPVLVTEVDDYASGMKMLRSLALADGQLYLFDPEAGVYHGDLADPLAPVFTYSFGTPARYGQISVHGDYMYARSEGINGNAALVIFDLADPLDPTPIGGSPPMFSSQLFAIDAAPPRVVGFGDELTVFDTSDPAAVQTVGSIVMPPATRGVVLGDHAWSFGFDGLDVWTLADPTQPSIIHHADIDLLGAEAVARLDGDPLVATVTDRLSLLDAGNPALPALTSSALIPGGALTKDVAVIGDKAFLLHDAYGLSVADAATLAPLAQFEPDLPSQLNLRSFEGFAIDGNRIYLAAWGYGMLVVDVSDPLNPVEIGRQPYEYASEVAVNGNFAYVGRSTNGGEVRIFDVSNPSQPVERGTISGINEPRRVQVHGNRVYVADALLGGVHIYDVSNPDAPQPLGIYDSDCEWLGNTAYDVVLSPDGQTAYAACPNGMHVVDVSSPSQPTRIGRYYREPDFLSSRPRVEVLGDRAWYADGSGVHEIDLTDPAAPAGLSVTALTYTAPLRLRAVADGRLFAFAGGSGVHVFGDAPAAPDDIIFADGFEARP